MCPLFLSVWSFFPSFLSVWSFFPSDCYTDYSVYLNDTFLFSPHFPYFENIKLVLCNHHAVSLCVCIPPINFWRAEPICMKFSMYIIAPDPHLNGVLHKPLPSVCVFVCVSFLSLLDNSLVTCIPPFIARQWLGTHVPVATNTCNNRRIAGHECLWVCLCIPQLLLGSNSVKTFLRQGIVVGVVFYVAHVASKESRQLALPRTSCLKLNQRSGSLINPT
jgi:hypothetical protein